MIFMDKKDKASISIMKIIGVSLIIILLLGVTVRATETSIRTVEITLANGYKMSVITSKTNVYEILEDNNIFVEEDERVSPGLDDDINESNKIVITNKSVQEVQIAKISESGIETTLDEILKEIKVAQNIVILTHESPDGDAIGSSLAMRLMLKELEKECDVIIPEYSRLFDFLPGIETIKKESEIKNYDLAIAVDCADIKRIAKKEYFENAKKTIVIDHHGSNNMFGDLNYVNPVSPACCEILAGIAEYFKMKITKELGTCIMTGIITDTGGFRHDGTNSETFEFAAELVRKGVNIPYIYKRTLNTKTKANFLLTKKVIDRMELLEDGKVTFTYITIKDEEEVNAEPGDHEGLVEIGRDIEGVEVSIFVRQKEENAFKISLRSGNEVNVSDVCLMFGGGGHPRAAGGLIQGTLEQVREKVLKEVKKAL